MARRRGSRRGCLGTGALVFGLIALGIASLAMTIVGATQTAEWFEAQDSLEPATAEVIDVSAWHQPPARNRPGSTSYRATVRFETLDGTTVEAHIDGTAELDVGDAVDILYDRDDPTTAFRADEAVPWFGPVSALVIGPLLGAGVIALAVVMVRGALASRHAARR